MGAFGKHKYATPFGALSPSGFFNQQGYGAYSYSGFSSRSGELGVSGYVGQSSLCGPDGMEFLPYQPTLTFPLNYAILQGVVRIAWKIAVPADPCNDEATYELQFTRTFSQDIGWKTLATDLPSGTSYYDFDVSEIPYTDDGGLRIRAKDDKNLYSDYSTCNEAFTIANHAPNSVTILSPFPGEKFDSSIPLVWREAKVKDVDGQAVVYKIEITDKFSSDSDWTEIPCAKSLPEGTTVFGIPASDLPEGADYGVRISAIDELGLGSIPKRVGALTVCHEGTFIIDTIPPEGSVSINDGAALAGNTKVKLTLWANDATTGIKDMRYRNEEEAVWSDWDSFANEKFWDLPSSDGVKRVLVQFRDYADNISEICDCEIVSRVLCDAGNVTDIEVFNDKLYAAFDANGNLVEYKVLVKRVAALPEPEITALARLGNYLFVATYDGSASSIYAFDGRAKKLFGISGTKVSSMQGFEGALYIASDDGKVRSYANDTLLVVLNATSTVTRLSTDGSILFATLEGSGDFYSTINGTTWKLNPL